MTAEIIPLFRENHPVIIRALERRDQGIQDVIALPPVCHRVMPAWVTADPVYSASVPHLERHGWDIWPLSPGVFKCSHPRVTYGPVDYVTALEITLMFLMMNRMKGTQNGN